MGEVILLIVCIILFVCFVDCKYMEGVIKTRENWAFLARFCFLSEEGQFEYDIEYNEDQGDLNLLLYYDTNDQWPAVYKSNKTCEERESVLNIKQNQIVNLTSRIQPDSTLSGCSFLNDYRTTPIPRYSFYVPTLPPKKTTTKKGITNTETSTISGTDTTTLTSFEDISTTEYSTTPFATSPYYTDSSFYTSVTSEGSEKENLLEERGFTTESYIETGYETIIDGYSTTLTTSAYYQKPPIKKRSLVSTKPQPKRILRRGRTVYCHSAKRFRSSRERWWFIAISNCNGTKGIDIKYRILMTNGPPGDYWHEQFSADEFYILPVLMAFSLAYSFLMLGIVMCSIELRSRQLLHTTYKIFVLSVVLQLLGIVFESACYLRYAVSGVPAIQVKRFDPRHIIRQTTVMQGPVWRSLTLVSLSWTGCCWLMM